MESGLQIALGNYFNSCFDKRFSSNNTSVECFVKRFFITGKDTILENLRKKGAIIKVKFEAECYYKVNDLLYPAVRIDTVFGYRVENFKKEFSQLVETIVSPLKQKLVAMDSSRIVQRKSYSTDSIQKRYLERLNLPILTNTCKCGIYKNLAEFKNNTPSITSFTVKKASNYRSYLVDSLGTTITPSKVFAYCDGNSLWLKWRESAAKLVRVGNSFEFLVSYGPKDMFGHGTYLGILILDLAADND